MMPAAKMATAAEVAAPREMSTREVSAAANYVSTKCSRGCAREMMRRKLASEMSSEASIESTMKAAIYKEWTMKPEECVWKAPRKSKIHRRGIPGWIPIWI